jgi:hypothetical protein
MTDWKDAVQSREPEPEKLALAKEEVEGQPARFMSLEDEKVIEMTWRDMRRLRPDLYAVFREWARLFALRDDSTSYSHGLYRGFYAEMSKRLSVTGPAVTHRLKKAKLWFARRLEKNHPTRKPWTGSGSSLSS